MPCCGVAEASVSPWPANQLANQLMHQYPQLARHPQSQQGIISMPGSFCAAVLTRLSCAKHWYCLPACLPGCLCGAGAGLNERHGVTGRTPLHEAVMLNNMATVQRLLEVGAQPNIGHVSQVRARPPKVRVQPPKVRAQPNIRDVAQVRVWVQCLWGEGAGEGAGAWGEGMSA